VAKRLVVKPYSSRRSMQRGVEKMAGRVYVLNSQSGDFFGNLSGCSGTAGRSWSCTS
jgi:hypothetical protein